MSRRNRKAEDEMRAYRNALYVEKQVSLELSKALRLHMAIADGLRKQIEELKEGA